MNHYFSEVTVGAEFWYNGTVWVKVSATRANSVSTTMLFKGNEIVVTF